MSALWQRQRNIIDFTLSSLMRRAGKLVALVLVFTSIVMLLASVMLFLSWMRHEARLLLAGSPDVVVQRLVAGRQDLIPEEYASRLKGIRGVSEVRPKLWGYWFDPVTRANYTMLVPAEGEPEPGAIRVGAGISRGRSAVPGDIVSLTGCEGESLTFVIDGILASDSELVSADLILISTEDFREFLGVAPGLATDVSVRVPNAREVPTVALKIAELLPDTRVVLRIEILRTYDAVFDWRGGIVVVLLAGAILAFVIFSWDKASGLSAEERREIGTLKAVGWETSDVLLMKFWEGVIVSLTSFLLGFLLAYVHVFFLKGALIAAVIKGWSVLYPAFALAPSIDPLQLATLFFLTVVPYTAATVIPSWKASIIDPDAVMRA